MGCKGISVMEHAARSSSCRVRSPHPRQVIYVERTVYLPAHHLLRAAEKVLQLNLATWFHTSAQQAFRDRWKDYGELVYVSTKSDLVTIHIPLEADFTECKP